MRVKRHNQVRWLVLAAAASALGACRQEAPDIGATEEALLSYPSDQGTVDYANASTSGTEYGGQIMTSPFTLHYIFYGSFTAAQRQVFLDFASGLSGSPTMSVLGTYFDGALSTIPTSFQVDYFIDAGYSHGQSLSDTRPIVDHAIASGVPASANDVYMIVFDPTVNFSDANGSLCNTECAAHGHDANQTPSLRYGWVGNPQYCASHGLPSCTLGPFASAGQSPNGDKNVDSMVDFVWHELAETLSNPEHNGYHVLVGSSGGDKAVEIADMCEFAHLVDGSFPAVGPVQLDLDYAAANGAPANVHLGSRDFLLQPIWQNADRGGCVRRVALNRPSFQPAAASGAITGDFDGNSVGDILWHNAQTGDVSIWLMNAAGQRVSYGTPLSTLPPRTQIVAVADFNGDGKADILMRDAGQGELILATMSGTSVTSLTAPFSSVPLDVLVKAIGDFDGDGKADILFQDMTSNATRVWFGKSGLSQYSALPATTPALAVGANVEAVGTGDFDGDGKSEVLWHDLGSDSYFTWSFSGTTVTTTSVTRSGFSSLYGIVDVDLDGQADLVGASADGRSVVWMRMNHGQAAPAAVVNGMPMAHWRFSGGGNLGPFGQAGFYWRNRQTGDISIWYLTVQGTLGSSLTVASPPGLKWEIVAY